MDSYTREEKNGKIRTTIFLDDNKNEIHTFRMDVGEYDTVRDVEVTKEKVTPEQLKRARFTFNV